MENNTIELFKENRNKWNELYKRSENTNRARLEADSVPTYEDWNDSILDYDYIVDYINEKDRKVLDIGTGNGAILGLLCKKYSFLSGVGLDISDEAISIGKQMLEKFSIKDRVEFLQNDMHDNWKIDKNEQFDIVMANFSLQFNTYESFIYIVKKFK